MTHIHQLKSKIIKNAKLPEWFHNGDDPARERLDEERLMALKNLAKRWLSAYI